MESYTLADAQMLNSIKNCVREIIRVLDTSRKVYPDALEASQVKHEVSELVSTCHLHSLLPTHVQIAPDATHVCE